MLTKWLRRLTVSKHHALNLTSCSFTQTAHVQGNQSFRWANRHHMLTWLGNRLTQGNAAPVEHLNNIYRTKSTLIIYSCRAWLPRWVFFHQYLCGVDEYKRPRHSQLCRCLCLLPTSVGHLAGLQTCWAAAAPSSCPKKKQLEKACDFSSFFLDADYCRLAATSWFLSSEILGVLTLL